MNRTITSNIAGTVFHIDEDAFRKLEQYLNDIRSFYSGQEGEGEIVSGIEERIGDIFRAKVKGGQSIITMTDVDSVISVMGRPEAFEGDEEADATERKSKKQDSKNAKRLFRDPDNRVLGGVCSGVSHYLGIHDPVWFRLAFLLSFIFAGTGLLLYIILWIVIPSAKTPAEKLEMRGEHVTVDNISRTVNEELEGLRKKWDSTAVGSNGVVRQISDFLVKAITLIVQVVVAIVKFLGRILGFFLLFIGVLVFMSILAVSVGLPTIVNIGSEGVVTSELLQGLMSDVVGGQFNAILTGLAVMLLVGIPFLAVAFLGARLMFNFNRGLKWIGLSLAVLWTVGLILSIVMAGVIGKDFSSEGERSQTVALELNAGTDERPIVLALNHDQQGEEPSEEVDIMGMQVLVADGVTSIYGKPTLDIEKSTNGKNELVIIRSSRGGSVREAADRANAIDYGFLTNDSSLLFNGYFAIPDADKWRGQDVKLQLRLAEGTTILLTDEMERIIYDIDNVTNTYDGDMVGRRWKMTAKGLECVDCAGLEDDTDKVLEKEEEIIIEEEQDMQKEEVDRARQLKKEAEQLREEQKSIRKKLTDSKEAETSSSEDVSEIILKRVVKATYRLGPETIRSITYTLPG